MNSRIRGVGEMVHDLVRERARRDDVPFEHITAVSSLVEHDDHSTECEFTDNGFHYRVIIEHVGEETT